MKQTITEYQFIDSFTGNYKDNFSYEGKQALFDFLEEIESELDEEIELDPIALCCEYTEYENIAELQENYTDIESMEDLEDHTCVIMIDDQSFIIQNY